MSHSTSAPAPLVVQNSGRWLGNDGSWSTFYVHVGTPPQHFHVLPNFGAQTLYIPIDQDCARLTVSNCGSLRGVEVFASRPSIGFQNNASSTWDELGTYRIGLGGGWGLQGNGLYGNDIMGPSLSGTIDVPTLENLTVAAYASPDFWLGQLGLSMFALNMSEFEQPHSFLSRLKEESHIPSLSFGYQAGAPYRFTKVPGSLILGGYDRARQAGKTLLVPSTIDTIVGIQGISLTNGRNTEAISLLEDGVVALLTTTVPELWLPPSVRDAFASNLGLTYHNESDRYIVDDEARHQLRDSSPTLEFKIGTSISGGETITIEMPYAAFDLQASYPIFAESINYFPLRRAMNESQYALGRTFLQEVYLSVDWERDVFNISQAAFSSPPPEADIVIIHPKNRTLVPLQSPSPDDLSSLSAGAIAGIVVGSVVVVILLIGTGWWLHRRRNLTKAYPAGPPVFPGNEKKDPNDFAPGNIVDSPDPRTDIELHGETVAEMYAPHGESEMHHARHKGTGTSDDVVEADGTRQVYELPSS